MFGVSVKTKDIAERAGVSMPTVSHVLGSRAYKYPQATQDRVFAAAQELGYRPHGSARAMRSGRFGCIALLLSTHPNHSSLFTQFLNGVQDGLAEHDLHLLLAKLPDEKLTDERFVPKVLRELSADGLLINYTHDIPERLMTLIRQNSLPSVWVNSKQEADGVRPDDFTAARTATEQFLALGHKRITYLDYPWSDHYSALDRYRGYETAMQAAGCMPCRVESEEVPTPPGTVGRAQSEAEQRSVQVWAAQCRALLSAPERPTAVIGYGDIAVEPMLSAAIALGLRVPKDLSLATFDDHVPFNTGLPITTWLVPEYTMGLAAVEMLLRKIEEPTCALPTRALPFEFDAGVTSAPPPSAETRQHQSET